MAILTQPLWSQGKAGLDQIYDDPGTAPALDLFERFGKRELNEAGFKSFLNSLPPESAAERAKVEKLLAEPGAAVDADLSTRGGQLAWAAGLGYAFQNSPPGSIRSHAIWRTLTRNPQLAGSLGAAARYVDLGITNRNATMDWGTPGSWFWFAPDKNHINIDLFHTLLTGFGKDPARGVKGLVHATGVMMHEVGHSQLTTRFTDKMIALQKREKELLDASKTRKLTQDEFKELSRTRTEFSLRMNLLNAAEDNCVNRFAANQGREFPHDFGVSLNMANVLLQGSGLYLKSKASNEQGENSLQEIIKKLMTPAKQKEIEEAGESLGNLNKTLALAFYATNGLFDMNDTATWQRLGIDPDKIRAEDSATGGATAADKFLGKESDFEKLMDLTVGATGIANLQPSGRDRWLLQSVFSRSVQSYADRRCQIMEEIWDKYAARYARVLIDAAEKNAENQMNQKKNGQQNNQQNGQGQGQGQGQGSGQSNSQSNGGGGGSSEQNSDDPSPSQGGGSGSGGGSQSQPGGDQEGGGSGSPSSVDVEGVGKMDIGGNALPSTPEQARQKNRKAAEDEAKPENAKTVRDLARDAKQTERNAKPGNDTGSNGPGNSGGPAGSQDQSDLSMKQGDKGGRQRGLDLASLSQGSWSEFRKRMNELEPVISRVADDFKYIRQQQRQAVRELSKEKEELPRGGDLRQRLDMRSHMNFAVKRATGQQIEAQDRQRWKVDKIATEATSVELWVLGDGSSSMKEGLPGGGRRIDSAVQSMAILYEAGRRADFDTFVGMWGDDQIRLLAAPGDSDQKIGDNFERVRNGINSGTQLSPSFAQAVHHSAAQETNAQGKKKRFAGMTHFLIISDGELNSGDIEPTAKMITKLFRYGPAVSIDIAILGGSGSEMEQVVAKVKQANPAASIAIIRADSAREIPVLLAQKIKRRFEQSSKNVQAVPDGIKREAFSKAYLAISQANLG